MNFATFGEAVAERARWYLTRDWSRHTDPLILCPLMLHALARALELGFQLEVCRPYGTLVLRAPGGWTGARLYAAEALRRHEQEAIELLGLFSAEPRPNGPSGEQ